MPRGACPRHAGQHPCTCAMGNLYRFVEPVLLFLLEKKGRSYGYELAGELRQYAFTDAEVEVAALYKTLRQLEMNGCVTSQWEMEGSGPARHVYALTPHGTEHLGEWVAVLDHMSKAMGRFVRDAKGGRKPAAPGRKPKAGRLQPESAAEPAGAVR